MSIPPELPVPCPPAASCADAQGAAQGVPTAPAACQWQGTSQWQSSSWAFPSPGPAGIISFFQSSPWRQLLRSSTTTATPAPSPAMPARRDEKKTHKAGTDFPLCPSEPFSPSRRSSAVCGGCVHEKPERPSGIAQPCRARSILPLNMKLPLSASALPRGWVASALPRGWVPPHFPSLTLAQRGGLRSSAFISLSFFPVLFSPPLLFPLLLQRLFQLSGDAGAAPAATVM